MNVASGLGDIRVAPLRGHRYHQRDWGQLDLGSDCLGSDLSCPFVGSTGGRAGRWQTAPREEATGRQLSAVWHLCVCGE